MANEDYHIKISRELGGINEKLESLPKIQEHLEKLNSRTRKLEDWKLEMKTRLAVISAGVSAVVGAIMWFITKMI